MPARIINLNRARKEKKRQEKEEKAAENRAKFGEPKAARERRNANAVQMQKRLANHERAAAGPEGGPEGRTEDGPET